MIAARLLSLLILLLPAVAVASDLPESGGYSPESDSLAEIVLTISPDQVVGQPLLQTARIVLLDESNALLTSYDLATNPITLVPAAGSLQPNVLDDPTLFVDGIIDFLSQNVTYTGRTGGIELHATDGTVQSSGVIVSFNGYDVLEAFDFAGHAITSIYSGLPTTINVTVQNRGSKVASSDPYVKEYFKSSGGSVKYYFSPKADGVVDTIAILIENTEVEPGDDTLVLELHSEYLINGSTYPTVSYKEIPVHVYTPATFSVVEGSVHPEKVYAGPDFDFSFQVEAVNFPGEIDSTDLTVQLVDAPGGMPLATIYEGAPDIAGYEGGVISYDSLVASVDSVLGLESGWYQLEFDYKLISGGNIFTVTNAYPDSLYLLAPADIQYLANTFAPTSVPGGKEAGFSFDLQFNTDDFPLEILPDLATFRIAGNGFSSTVSLIFPSDTLLDQPLAPDVVKVETEKIIIPANLIGGNLSVNASFGYQNLEAANSLTFTTDFDLQQVAVVELPAVRIEDVRIVAPNRPNVNTGQAFRIRCQYVNETSTPIENLTFRLVTNGSSTFDSLLTVNDVPGDESGEVFFDVVAASLPNPEERFRVSIKNTDINILAPIDDVALANIQTPARIDLTYSVSNGAQDGLVAYGESFNIVVSLDNLGQASVDPGTYRFSTDGVDFGVDDPTVGVIDADTTLIFFLTAPDKDTTAQLRFYLTERPLDKNTGSPALVEDTSFVYSIDVASGEAELTANAVPSQSNLVLPGSTRDLFDLELSNGAMSSIWDMEVETIKLSFVGPEGKPIDARSLIEIGSTGFFENGKKVATATAGGSDIVMYFDNFVVEASQLKTLTFRARFLEGLDESFTVSLDKAQVKAKFLDERVADIPVPVVSDSEDSSIIAEVFKSAGTTLESSFMIQTNPFDPNNGDVRFSYVLKEPSAVQLKIFTLVGEEVKSEFVRMGEYGTEAGIYDDVLTWDGRNETGDMVLNGVYVAILQVIETGEEARIKVAVVKR